MTVSRSMFILCLCGAPAWTQTAVDWRTQLKNVQLDFGMISGTAPISQGGTGATTAAGALSNIGGVSSAGAYVNPNWLTSFSWNKLTDVPGLFAPTVHAASHRHGGPDEIASFDAVANGIPKADGSGKLSSDWLELSGYQISLGFTPLNPANSLGELSDSASARLHLGLGDAALKGVRGIGSAAATMSGGFVSSAIPVVDSTGTQVDSGCSALGGVLTCNSGGAARIGLTKGTAPPDTAIDGVIYDAVLHLDSSDNVLKILKRTGPAVTLGTHTIHFTIDGGGSAITPGSYPIGQLASACNITGWSLIADQPGSIAVDLDAHTSSPPPAAPAIPNTATDNISGAAPMSLSNAMSASGGANEVLTWTTVRAAWDSFAINITSATTVKRVNGTVYCQ